MRSKTHMKKKGEELYGLSSPNSYNKVILRIMLKRKDFFRIFAFSIILKAFFEKS